MWGSDELYLGAITAYYTGITNYLQGARQTNTFILGLKALLCQVLCRSHIFLYKFQSLATSYSNLTMQNGTIECHYYEITASILPTVSHTAADVGCSSLSDLVELPIHVGNALSYYQLHHFQSNLQASLGQNANMSFFVGFCLAFGLFFGFFFNCFLKETCRRRRASKNLSGTNLQRL